MKCRTCEREFDNMSDLQKHIWSEHKKPEVPQDDRIIIPIDALDEFKYLSVNQPARILCLGHMEKEGFVVDEIRYHM